MDLAYAIIGMLAALGGYLFLTGNPAWPTWILWAALGMLLGPRHPSPLNDVSRLGTGRTFLGILLVIILILVFVPVPLVIVAGH